ncbi:uncharacterized protein TNCV_2720371 [Trichonephila clavipes]|nr:uncharacterized protein TNCV_2720371 [Trichonephila clavipes]
MAASSSSLIPTPLIIKEKGTQGGPPYIGTQRNLIYITPRTGDVRGSFSRLKPQVQDYVEVRNPQNTVQPLEVLSKFEERYSCKTMRGSGNSDNVERRGWNKRRISNADDSWKNSEVLRRPNNDRQLWIIFYFTHFPADFTHFPASHYGHFLCQRLLFSFAVQRHSHLSSLHDSAVGNYENDHQGNQWFDSKNRFQRDDRRFNDRGYQFRNRGQNDDFSRGDRRNRGSSDNFSRGDRRQRGRLNVLKVSGDQNDQTQSTNKVPIKLSSICMSQVELP